MFIAQFQLHPACFNARPTVNVTPNLRCFSSEATRPLQLRRGSGLAGNGGRLLLLLPPPSRSILLEGRRCPASLSLSLSLSFPLSLSPMYFLAAVATAGEPKGPTRPTLFRSPLSVSLPPTVRKSRRARLVYGSRSLARCPLPRSGFQPFNGILVVVGSFTADMPSLGLLPSPPSLPPPAPSLQSAFPPAKCQWAGMRSKF